MSRKSHPLPGETCPAGAAACAQSAGAGNSGGQRTGVSRGRSSTGNELGVGVHLPRGALKGLDGLTHVRRTELIGTAETAASFQLELALNADSAEERGPAAETDRGQGGLWECTLSPENLNEAWRRVREDGGAAGIDRMSVAAFPAFYRAHWTKVRAKLQAGTYAPSPVRRTLIPKKSGGEIGRAHV